MGKISTRIILAFSLVLGLSIIDTASNYLLSLKVKENSQFLAKSQDVIRNSGRLHKAMIEMQSSFRGYLLTQDSSFLEGFKIGLNDIPGLLEEQRRLIKGNHEQIVILDSISQLHTRWVSYADQLIVSMKIADKFEQLMEETLKKQVGKKLNDEISKYFQDFDKTEYAVRSRHSANLTASIQRTHTISLIFFVLTIVTGISTTIYIVTLISRRIKTMVHFAEDVSGGNFRNIHDDRQDELTRLSISLNKMSDSLSSTINELERQNAELDKFAYVVSHDLKAPVRGIHNVIKWIEEDLSGELSPELNKYHRIIDQRTERMENLINGLLDYAKTREKLPVEETNVHELVNEIVEEIVPRGIPVIVQALPSILTEKLKLHQVFMNLISNAVKYRTDNATILISYRDLPSNYEFSVKDNGIGIDPEYHSRIFEIFQTLREKDEKESTGIGLAIIKKIIDDLGCSIKVISKRGEGAEFIFTWPK